MNELLSRRHALGLMGAIAGAAAVTPLSEAAEPHPDAALLAAWNAYRTALTTFEEACERMPGGGTDADHEPYLEAICHYSDAIRDHRAVTLEGMALQLRLLFARMLESQSAQDTAVWGKPIKADLAEELTDDRFAALWAMASRVPAEGFGAAG